MRGLLMCLCCCLLPGLAVANEDAKRLCDSMNAKALDCYARWTPNSLNLASMGVAMALKENRKEFPGVTASVKTQKDLYEYAMAAVKPGSKKADVLKQAHQLAIESFNQMLPRAGVTEAARVKDVAQRKQELEKLVAKLLE